METPRMAELAIRRGLVPGPRGLRETDLLVSDGRIVARREEGEPLPAREEVDAHGKVVLPGMIDAHVHFREPGLAHKEDFTTGSLSAAAGGVTTVMVMPTDDPFTLTAELFAEKRALAEGRTHVDFALQAGLGPNLQQVRDLADLGAISFEIFLSDLPPALLTGDAGSLMAALEAVKAVDRVAGVTPGDDSLYARSAMLAKALYGTKRRAFAASRPTAAEAIGVSTSCTVARLVRARIHLRQISCADSLVILGSLGGRGISAEVTPHNLTLDEDALLELGPVAKVAPPLRPASDVAAVRRALAEGLIDMVASDHAPHHPDEKAAGRDDIWKAPGGFPGVQTLLPLMLRLVGDGVLTWERLAAVGAETPARTFGLYPRKGTLQVGSDADFVIVDPHRPMTIRNEDQQSKARLVPFHGMESPATPILAYLRAVRIMENGVPVGPPMGKFVAP